MIARLTDHTPRVQEESSLQVLTTCARQGLRDLPKQEMVSAFNAALNQHRQTGRTLEVYGNYTLNVLRDTPAAMDLFQHEVQVSPGELIFRVTLVRLLAITGHFNAARNEFARICSDQRLMLGPSTVHQLKHCVAPGQSGVCYVN